MKRFWILSLIIALAAFGCKPKAKTDPTKDPKVAIPDKAADSGLTVLAFSQPKEGALPAQTAVKLAITPNTEKKLAVSWVQADPSPARKTLLWTGGMLAAYAIGKNLVDYKITADAAGEIDEMGSQLAIAAGIMAAMVQTPPKAGVVLFGALNPDGTVGPVENLPAKIKAAATAGAKIIGIPAGQDQAWDEAAKQYVTCAEMGKAAGAEITEVATITEAFSLLTGSKLELPEPVAADALKLDADTEKLLKERCDKWLKQHTDLVKKINAIPGKQSDRTKNGLTAAVKYAEEATTLIKAGSIAAAYDYAQRAGAFAMTALWSAQFDALDAKKDLKGMLKAVESFDNISKQITETITKLRTVADPTALDPMIRLTTYDHLAGAWGYAKLGEKQLKESREKIAYLIEKKLSPAMDEGRLFQLLLGTATRFSMADMKNAKAQDFAAFPALKTGKWNVNADRAAELADMLEATARAWMELSSKVFVQEVAAAGSKSSEEVLADMIATENNYLVAVSSLDFPEFLISQDAKEGLLIRVAAYWNSYLNNAMLFLKRVHLEVRKDATGEVHQVRQQKVLAKLIVSAEENARRSAALAQKVTGTIPASARFYYQVGMTMKNGAFGLQIKSLEMFWKAATECQLAVLLVR